MCTSLGSVGASRRRRDTRPGLGIFPEPRARAGAWSAAILGRSIGSADAPWELAGVAADLRGQLREAARAARSAMRRPTRIPTWVVEVVGISLSVEGHSLVGDLLSRAHDLDPQRSDGHLAAQRVRRGHDAPFDRRGCAEDRLAIRSRTVRSTAGTWCATTSYHVLRHVLTSPGCSGPTAKSGRATERSTSPRGHRQHHLRLHAPAGCDLQHGATCVLLTGIPIHGKWHTAAIEWLPNPGHLHARRQGRRARRLRPGADPECVDAFRASTEQRELRRHAPTTAAKVTSTSTGSRSTHAPARRRRILLDRLRSVCGDRLRFLIGGGDRGELRVRAVPRFVGIRVRRRKRSGRDSNPRARCARTGCFQGSCNQPDSATAPSTSTSRIVIDRRLARHSSIRWSMPPPSRT